MGIRASLINQNREFQAVVPFPGGENDSNRGSKRLKTARGNKTAPDPKESDIISSQPDDVLVAHLTSPDSQTHITSTETIITAPEGCLATAAVVSPKDTGLAKELNFQMTESQIRREKMADCEFECSQINSHLFVGGQFVAENWNVIESHGITRIINCSAGVIANNFADKPNVKYLTLNMVDGRQDDISWFACEVIQFILKARINGERVLLHCEKGVSRSCSFAILYTMFSTGE
jgi:hypothetical protein